MKLGLSLASVEVQTPKAKSGYSVVPTGKYLVTVGSAETKETGGGTGQALILGYKIVDGEHEGKLIKDFLNVVNKSADAQRIALERLATVAWATNAPLTNGVLEDSDDLLNKAVFEIFAEQIDDGEYKTMKVKAVICTRSLEPIKSESAAAQPQPTTKKAAPPWKSKQLV